MFCLAHLEWQLCDKLRVPTGKAWENHLRENQRRSTPRTDCNRLLVTYYPVHLWKQCPANTMKINRSNESIDVTNKAAIDMLSLMAHLSLKCQRGARWLFSFLDLECFLFLLVNKRNKNSLDPESLLVMINKTRKLVEIFSAWKEA